MRPAVPSFALGRSVHRSTLRQRIFTRNVSSGTEGSQKKAQDALAGAQKQAGQLWESSKKALEPAGQRLSGLLGCKSFHQLHWPEGVLTRAQAYKQPLFYNLAMARELLKHIYRAENLSPPSLGAIQTAYSTIISRAVSPAFWREAVVSGEILRIGVYGLEAYGIYKVRAPACYFVRMLKLECVRLER